MLIVSCGALTDQGVALVTFAATMRFGACARSTKGSDEGMMFGLRHMKPIVHLNVVNVACKVARSLWPIVRLMTLPIPILFDMDLHTSSSMLAMLLSTSLCVAWPFSSASSSALLLVLAFALGFAFGLGLGTIAPDGANDCGKEAGLGALLELALGFVDTPSFGCGNGSEFLKGLFVWTTGVGD
jgi:hypothetical protein